MAENKQPSTKEKLAAIVNGFDDFDSEMKIGTRQRREQDEFKIADLKNTMTRLDSELIIEIKRRTEMNKSTQMVRLVVSECYCLMKRFQETQSYIKFIRISLQYFPAISTELSSNFLTSESRHFYCQKLTRIIYSFVLNFNLIIAVV